MSDIEQATEDSDDQCRNGDGAGADRVGGSSGNDEDEGGSVSSSKEETNNEQTKEFGKRIKKVSLFGFRKGKKLLHRRRAYVNSGSCWRTGRAFGCFSCLKQPRNLDSSGESPTSDPNSSEFTFDRLRTLIEKNDFYSKECNPHLDGKEESDSDDL